MALFGRLFGQKTGTAFDGRVKVIFVGQSGIESFGRRRRYRKRHDVFGLSFKSDVNSSYLREDYRYEMNDAVLISKREGKLKLDEIIRRYVYDTVKGYMPENADLAYSLITAIKTRYLRIFRKRFSRAGIAHLLAVSGLHVGFCSRYVSVRSQKVSFACGSGRVACYNADCFYAYACGFTPSVMRAVIMAACSYLAKIALRKIRRVNVAVLGGAYNTDYFSFLFI